MSGKETTPEEILVKRYNEFKWVWSLPPVDPKYKSMVISAMEEYAELARKEGEEDREKIEILREELRVARIEAREGEERIREILLEIGEDITMPLDSWHRVLAIFTKYLPEKGDNNG